LLAVTVVVRTAIGPDVRLRTHRSLDERLFVRWPWTYVALARAVLLLPPRSRLRRAMLRRSALSGWAAWSRRDLDLMVVRAAVEHELEQPAELVGAGLRSSYRGHRGFRDFDADAHEAWERMDTAPVEIVDAGDRFVILGHLRTRARASGVELDTPFAQAMSLERGLIVRSRIFYNWDDALRASGIPADAPGDLDVATDAGAAAAPD
jgi:ketosteroid isomerase-like protein